METRGTTGEETISYWFELPIDVAEFEEKLGVGAESGDYRIIEKVLPYADEVHEHTKRIGNRLPIRAICFSFIFSFVLSSLQDYGSFRYVALYALIAQAFLVVLVVLVNTEKF